IIVLGLAGHWISTTESWLDAYYAYAALAVAVSVLTLITVPAMLIIDIMRRGAFTSMILVELVWLGLLWVLWLASAADSANNLSGFGSTCHSEFFPDWWTQGCSETQAIVAFSFLNWIGLTGYLVSLLTLSIVAAQKGAPVWKSSVKEASFVPVNVDLSGAMGAAESKPAVSTPMQEQPALQSYPTPVQTTTAQPYQPTTM
ncbi:hypothetical protein PHLGIDRAFT_68017, partial [Phlebiopsis gigantea 11061_1 CR5-6]